MTTRPLPAPDRPELPADRAAHDAVVARCEAKFGRLTPYHAALLNGPGFAAALNELGRVARTAGDRTDSYSHTDREWVDQVLSADLGTNVVQRIHVPDALAVGVRAEAILALRAGREDELTEDERLLTRYVRSVVSGSVDDADFDRLVRRLGRRGATEYTIFIGFLHMTIRLWQALGMEDPPDAEIDALLHAASDADGGPPADYRVRIG